MNVLPGVCPGSVPSDGCETPAVAIMGGEQAFLWNFIKPVMLGACWLSVSNFQCCNPVK